MFYLVVKDDFIADFCLFLVVSFPPRQVSLPFQVLKHFEVRGIKQ